MKNIEKVSSALSQWLTKIAASVMPKVKIPADSQIGKIMSGFFGIDMKNYNVWNELGFLLEPTVESFVGPSISKYLSMIPEEKIPEVVGKYVDSFIEKASKDGYVNLFGIQLGSNVFEDLKQILEEELGNGH